ncbi:MAG: hypothetical protein JOY80_08120, partial [Candidatus Dormibacteraeota bacterium]|nr:hypothetical protein [Candidatus Dormibacteraeota bacterium]
LTNGSSNACAPPTDGYTIPPGRYTAIVINHGTYEFGPGVFYIDGTAPVDTQTIYNTGNYHSTGIDHSQEKSQVNNPQNELDLCPYQNNVQICSTLTAGVWIGHGQGWSAQAQTLNGSCSGGGGGGASGGGDQTNISGSGVTFVMEPGSGGFVSTNEVQSINLNAPGYGTYAPDGSLPILFDEENSSFIHLDANNSNSNGFGGIIYQTTSATAGGVELNPGLAGNQDAVTGQILAYSLALFGHNGPAVDFQSGYGVVGNQISNSGSAEDVHDTHITNYPVNGESPPVSQADPNRPGYTEWIFRYLDEWALDAYNVNISINNGPAVYFSEGTWTSPNQGFTETNVPSDTYPINPRYQQTYNSTTLNPATPSTWSSSVASYSQGTTGIGTTGVPNGNNETSTWDWAEKVKDPTLSGQYDYIEVSGDWMWGHEQYWIQQWGNSFGVNNSGMRGNNSDDLAQVTFSFPNPNGNNYTLSMFMEDGDHCGDYYVFNHTYPTSGGPSQGNGTAGSVDLEQ